MNTKKSPLIFEISQNNFNDLVIKNSHQIPVFVEFMGVWSQPCIKMEYALTDLAKEFATEFIFAKIDIDEQDEIKQKFKIINIPTLLVFKNGVEVQREEGEFSADELRIFLKYYGVFNVLDDIRQKARQKHLAGDTNGAILDLTNGIRQDPSNTKIALDMVQIFLDINEIEQAISLFARLPEDAKKTDIGIAISSQMHFIGLAQKTAGMQDLQTQILQNPDNHQARFDLAICLFAKFEFDQGMEELFFIQQYNPDFKEKAAQEMIGVICNMLSKTDNEKSAEYRQRLASMIM